jgi:CheY-like chemotaxis protein
VPRDHWKGWAVAVFIGMLHPILVVHRQRGTRDRVVRALDEAGFVGIPAATGHEVLEYLQSGGEAAVILRQATPDEGWTTFAHAQRRDVSLARIPVIALSPLHEREEQSLSADEALDVSSLILIVKHLCAGTRAAGAPFARPRISTSSGAVN